LVFPDGENSWYLNSPLKSEMQYESYFIDELIPFIEQTFPAKKNKNSRAIMGASMGGHGAMMLAAKYPDLFWSVSSFFGITKLTDKVSLESNLVGPFLTELLGNLDQNLKIWEANSAYELAENFSNKAINIFFDCGRDDETPALVNNMEFHKRLNELKIPHIWKERAGGHTKEYLNENLKEHMDFHWQLFRSKME
jgi:S-formylglutathione hydrolase FrmB